MSAPRLLLEGTSLPPLLARVEELGGRVVSAARVQRGRGRFAGPGRYELTVELPGLGARPAAAGAGTGGRPGGAGASGGSGGVSAPRTQGSLALAARRPPPDPDVPASLADILFGFESAETVQLGGRRNRRQEFTITAPHALRALGVPETLVPQAPALADALDELAARLPLPRPLAQQPGQVIVLAGPPGDGLDVCAQMLGLIAVRVQLAHVGQAEWPGGGHRLTGVESVRALRERARDAVVLAVIPSYLGRVRAGTAELLSALAPTQVWAAVDAQRPAAELRAELAELAREVPVGALAVRNASTCTRPGALLGLGFPVGWLDGLPASRVVWTRLLEEAAATLVVQA